MEGDIFGRLTPPPEDILGMERGFFNFPTNIFGEQSCCDEGYVEEENSLLDLEFKTICPREFDGQKSGPTLAELNDTRSRSPLINPEMKRLHQVAILTIGDTDEEVMCESASVSKTQSSSVLERQLRTQPSASVYHEQHLPSYSNCSTPVSSTVSRSEGIAIPNRDPNLAQTVCLSPPSPQDRKPLTENLYQERKPFEHFYQTQSIHAQFSQSYPVQKGVLSISNCTPGSLPNPRPTQQQACETSASHEQVAIRMASNAYHSENCDESEDDDDMDSDADDVEDTEEYCPFKKRGQNPGSKERQEKRK